MAAKQPGKRKDSKYKTRRKRKNIYTQERKRERWWERWCIKKKEGTVHAYILVDTWAYVNMYQKRARALASGPGNSGFFGMLYLRYWNNVSSLSADMSIMTSVHTLVLENMGALLRMLEWRVENTECVLPDQMIMRILLMMHPKQISSGSISSNFIFTRDCMPCNILTFLDLRMSFLSEDDAGRACKISWIS